MLFHVRMTVSLPHDIAAPERDALLRAEREAFTRLHRAGKWPYLWRTVGQRANVSIFDVDSPDELHQILWELPLFPFLTVEVTPVVEHPSLLAIS